MNTPKEKLAANSSLETCSLSLEDRAAEYAEALNDIADMLQLPTGATSADIVAACYRVLNMPTEQNGLSQSNATDHPATWHPFCDGPLYYPCLVTDGTNVEKAKGKPRKKTWVFSHAKLRLIPTHWMPLPIPPSNQDDLQELRDFASKNVKMKDTAENGPRKHSDL